MKGWYYSWPFTVLFFLLILLSTSCQLLSVFHTENITLESGFEIPQGKMPQREVTYDDPFDGPAGVGYRSGAETPYLIDIKPKVKVAKVTLGDNVSIYYRDNIETKAGQIRINIVTTISRDIGSWGSHKVNLKLANIPKDIQVKNTGVSIVGKYSIVLMMEILPQVKPGDYKIGLLVFIDDQYYGELPCTIHVIK
ncbi:MAG: hypothetical protein ABSA18_04285 [Dehalococcoidia bacterium]|jgi:hypothetical protein